MARPGPPVQILCYLAAVLLAGALLAPPMYHGGKWLAGAIAAGGHADTALPGWIGRKLTTHQFDSYYNRAFLVSALGLLWPFLRWMGMSRGSFGLQPNPMRAADLFAGFILASASLAVMGIGLVQAGAFVKRMDADWDSIARAAVIAAAGAALVEEWLFRGIFLGIALRTARPWTAIVLVSALFGILHVIQAPDIAVRDAARRTELRALESDWPKLAASHVESPASLDWTVDESFRTFAPSQIDSSSGMRMTAAIFRRNFEPAVFLSEFLTLFGIGLLLAWARVRTASIWLPIGLHAGLIYLNSLFMGATRTTRALRSGEFDFTIGDLRIPIAGTQLKLGLLPLAVLAVLAAAVAGWLHIRARKIHGLRHGQPRGDAS